MSTATSQKEYTMVAVMALIGLEQTMKPDISFVYYPIVSVCEGLCFEIGELTAYAR